MEGKGRSGSSRVQEKEVPLYCCWREVGNKTPQKLKLHKIIWLRGMGGGGQVEA